MLFRFATTLLLGSALPLAALAADTPAATEERAPGLHLGVAAAVFPMGMGLRAIATVSPHVEAFLGGSVSVAVFAFDSAPLRFRGEAGVLYYPSGAGKGFFVGAQGTGALWTETPILGGSNLAVGPTVGGAAPLGDEGAALFVGVGVLGHFYVDEYNSFIDQGDGFQALPQLDLVLVLPHRNG